jgi:uncharacterized 2Fe-2S/4Fe-4S cluster protein (DUF4445 family)
MAEDLCRVDFEPVGKRVDVPAGATLLEAARAAGVELASVCGGHGHCGRCRLAVLAGAVNGETEADRSFLAASELAAGQRLACQARLESDVRVHVPPASLVTSQRLQVAGDAACMAVDMAGDVAGDGAGDVDATVRGWQIEAPAPSLADHRADFDRVCAALAAEHGPTGLRAGPSVLRQLSPLARRTGWRLTAYVRGAEVAGFAAPGRAPVGLAVDLGTTKIAGYLADLETGTELAAAGIMNPQIAYGEDVITRLAHAVREPGGAERLAAAVRTAIDSLAGELAADAGIARDQIVAACVVGNTAMHHLLLGLPVRQLATSPFVPATARPLDVPATDLGLDLAPGASVLLPPCVSGFVGADHVAMVLAAGLDRPVPDRPVLDRPVLDRPVLDRAGLDQHGHVAIGLDIGTNTEIALSRRGTLTSTSCASGPAFEGAHIRHGMRAADGAIEGVRLARSPNGELRVAELRVVGGGKPTGICGSGIVDAIAELHRTGLLNARGRLDRDAPGVRRGRDGLEVLIAPAAETGNGADIVVIQGDVDEIQLAKGAIAAGVQALVAATGTDPAEVGEVIVAGAFGTYLNLASALDIGLLPRFPGAAYRQVGNAAGAGARAVLLSAAARTRAQRIAERISYVELTSFPGFQRLFAHAMQFSEPQAREIQASETRASETRASETRASETRASETQNDTTGG